MSMKSGHAVYVKFTLKSVIKILNEAGSLKEESSTFRKKKKKNKIQTDTKKC